MQSILDAINEWIKELLIGAINGNLSTMFGDVNEKVGTIAAEVGKTPQAWNANIFSMIKTLSENVIVPIAGIVITYVLCYELISMVIDKNNMHDFDTFMFFKWFFKAWVAVFLVTHTFDITMAVFDVAQHVVARSAGVIGGSTSIDVASALSSLQAGLDSMEIPELLLLTMGTSYTSEDADLIAVERQYEGMESDLQSRVNRIEQDYPGYDEYRYDLSMIGHNPHELASYLTAKYQSYTLSDVRSELSQIFEQQYTLTLTREVETRYREETHTETYTDEDGNTYTETVTEQVPYDYYILNVKLTNTPLSSFLPDKLNEEQRKMYAVYLETSGNKPLIFGGGSPDTSPSTDLSGVHFVNGKRPGNTAVVDIAKRQEGNVGGYPYWSWYGFNGRVAWCACFVSWCYHEAGLSEPRFAACQSQGVPWFTSRGQWGARGYKDIAPGDAIFFDWDLDGSADHVGIVIGRDNERVYTVEGNSGDACKIKSYSLNYECIKGYGLMNWD